MSCLSSEDVSPCASKEVWFSHLAHIQTSCLEHYNMFRLFLLEHVLSPIRRCFIPTHCNTLQHTATHCNTLQHTVRRALEHVLSLIRRGLISTHCNSQQHTANTATHRITLQHTATHCNTQYKEYQTMSCIPSEEVLFQHAVTHCNTLQHTATHCNTLQHTATHCNTHSTKSIRPCLVSHQKKSLVFSPFASKKKLLSHTVHQKKSSIKHQIPM